MSSRRIAWLVALVATTATGACQFSEREAPPGHAHRPGGEHLTLPPGQAPHRPLATVASANELAIRGKAVFYRDWTGVAGPDYDQVNCASCHLQSQESESRL